MNVLLKKMLLILVHALLMCPEFSQVPAGFEVQQIADMGDEAPINLEGEQTKI